MTMEMDELQLHERTWMNLKYIILNREARHSGIRRVCFHLYEAENQAKLTCIVQECLISWQNEGINIIKVRIMGTPRIMGEREGVVTVERHGTRGLLD